ncbi:hypothetical protein BASA81_001294 [Batrachochytrium salamandrivorans]|nr:hypothetical protein BASA81_001294 [Batrachochytrium salamandrivorans]
MSKPAAGLASAILLRQAGVTVLRRAGRANWLHAHDSISLVPLLATLVSCLYTMGSGGGAGRVSMTSPFHVAVCLGPQTLAWFTCLRNRHELSRADFPYHVAGVGLCLLLAVLDVSPILAVGVGLGGTGLALLRRNTLAVLFWLVLALLVSQKAWGDRGSKWEAWVTMFGEVVMMFAIKFRVPCLASSPSAAAAARHKDSTADVEQAETDDVVFDLIPSPQLVPLQDSASPSPPFPLPPPPSSTLLPGLFPTFHHRRDVSIQSNSSWSWGPAVADFTTRNSRSSLSNSSEEEEEDEVDGVVHKQQQPEATKYAV